MGSGEWGGIEVHRARVHIRQDWRGTGVHDGVDRGAERHRRGDDLVAGFESEHDAGKV